MFFWMKLNNSSREAEPKVNKINISQMTQQGKVKWFDVEKGFGFIEPEDGSKDVFVHRNNVENLDYNQGLEDGENVEFNVEETPKGLSATDVRSLDYK
jgi:CspA family cold shock protein